MEETSQRERLRSNVIALDNAWQQLVQPAKAMLSMTGIRAPLLVLVLIAFQPKFAIIWIAVILAKPFVEFVYRRLPHHAKANFEGRLPARLRNSRLLKDLNEGAEQGLPFILFFLYICCAPFALAWMIFDWVRGFFPSRKPKMDPQHGFIFTQNKKNNPVYSEGNFYHSRAFGIIILAFFALGIPAFFSFATYERLGVSRIVENAKMLPPLQRAAPKMTPAAPKMRPAVEGAPPSYEPTVVIGYNGWWPWLHHFGVTPTKSSIFFVHFYLMGLAIAMSVLFFRAWFQFPLNFLTDEHDVEITESGIRVRNPKGWFLNVITMNKFSMGAGTDRLEWDQVKSLRRLEEGFARLYPLPETAFKKQSLSYKLLNKIAAFIDGISSKVNTANYLVFSSAESGNDYRRNIKINLGDLNREQRARLFYAVKKWAPHVVIQEHAEEQLLGSTVLRDQRYTQLWFDMLTSRSKPKRQSMLASKESLKDGAYTVVERISSGGQATTYLATKASGEKCVLKEFILSTSRDEGALLESAREFEAEVSLLSQLDHPNIVRVQDYFYEDGRVYVVLDYVDGLSLRQKVLRDGALCEREVVAITKSLCDVLEYLHNCNPPIVHRDITPENILLDADGEMKLIDFSLAVRQDGRRTTDSCAKQCFTPPEQFREEACPQSDIYALGATMYFLLTGTAPKPISCSSPITKARQVSPALNAIVERATKLELAERYESAHWIKLDLAAIEEAK